MKETNKIQVSHEGVVSMNLKGENGKRIARKLMETLTKKSKDK